MRLARDPKTVLLSADQIPKPGVSKGRQKSDLNGPLSIFDGCTEMEESMPASLEQLPLPDALAHKMYRHQRVGVDWMYHLFKTGSGGILGDDMGMGKTFQVVCLLVGLMRARKISRVLILAPVTVLPSWQRELATNLAEHVEGSVIELMCSTVSKKRRVKILESVFETSQRSVVICSHQLVVTMEEELSLGSWDYIVLDEGHVIKNPQTKLAKAMHNLNSSHRILLTGTPIQNNLSEFWSVMNWATRAACLGSIRQFNTTIADPIIKGQDPKASESQRQAATVAIKLLVQLTRPFLLQRKKVDHLVQGSPTAPSASHPADAAPMQPGKLAMPIPEKKEFVVWIALASEQKQAYAEFLASSTARNALSRSTYPVEVINTLKVLCRHPLLVEFAKLKKLSSAASLADEEDVDDVGNLTQGLSQLSMQGAKAAPSKVAESIYDLPDHLLNLRAVMKGSIKLRILVHMVRRLVERDHRVLVFSQSKIMLQLFQYTFAQFKLASYKIDGSTSYKERQAIIDDFNSPADVYSGPRICLLTTKACGFGITLTGADRVIIYDPSWNPAEDNQAVDRAYRIGQTRPVRVYRFIHTGCLEQKVYEKQVFKEGLREASEKGNETKRYFSGQNELKELLALDRDDEVPGSRPSSRASQSILSLLKSSFEGLRDDYLVDDDATTLYGVAGVTRHDQLYLTSPAAASVPVIIELDGQAKNALPMKSRPNVVIDLTGSYSEDLSGGQKPQQHNQIARHSSNRRRAAVRRVVDDSSDDQEEEIDNDDADPFGDRENDFRNNRIERESSCDSRIGCGRNGSVKSDIGTKEDCDSSFLLQPGIASASSTSTRRGLETTGHVSSPAQYSDFEAACEQTGSTDSEVRIAADAANCAILREGQPLNPLQVFDESDEEAEWEDGWVFHHAQPARSGGVPAFEETDGEQVTEAASEPVVELDSQSVEGEEEKNLPEARFPEEPVEEQSCADDCESFFSARAEEERTEVEGNVSPRVLESDYNENWLSVPSLYDDGGCTVHISDRVIDANGSGDEADASEREDDIHFQLMAPNLVEVQSLKAPCRASSAVQVVASASSSDDLAGLAAVSATVNSLHEASLFSLPLSPAPIATMTTSHTLSPSPSQSHLRSPSMPTTGMAEGRMSLQQYSAPALFVSPEAAHEMTPMSGSLGATAALSTLASPCFALEREIAELQAKIDTLSVAPREVAAPASCCRTPSALSRVKIVASSAKKPARSALLRERESSHRRDSFLSAAEGFLSADELSVEEAHTSKPTPPDAT